MKKTLRILSLALSVMMLMSICFATTAMADKPKKVKLVFVCPGAVPFDSLPDNALVLEEVQKRYLADRNVDLEIVIKDCSWSGYEQLMQVEIASGEQIDMFPAWSSMAESFISNEMVYEFTPELLEEHGPNILKVVPELAWRWMTVDGAIYGLPRLRSLHDVQFKAMRKDWLDACGLPVPTTHEEYEAALYAIAKLDPVGNGMTIAHHMRLEYAPSVDFVDTTANQMTDFFLAEDGKIYHSSQHPALKEGVDRFRQWYADGIINKDCFTVTKDEENARQDQHRVAVRTMTVSNILACIKTLREVAPDGEYVILPSFDGGYNLSKAASDFLLVPANSKNLENLVDFFDWMLEDKENFLLVRYGIEGRHYVKVGDQIDRIENAEGSYDYDGVLNGTFDMYGLEGYGSDAVVDFVINNFSDPVLQDIYENEYQVLLAQMKVEREKAVTPDLFGFTYKLDGIAAQTRDARKTAFTEAVSQYAMGRGEWSEVEKAVKNYQEGLGGPEEFEMVNEQYQEWCKVFNCK